MQMFKVATLSLALLAGIAATSDADANGRRHHHHHRGHFGFYFGAPSFPYFAAPYYPAPYYAAPYYPRYYYPPTVVVPAPSPSVYIEQGAPAALGPSASAQGSPAYWYYCTDSQTYYPYVQRCGTPWQQVVPQVSPPPS